MVVLYNATLKQIVQIVQLSTILQPLVAASPIILIIILIIIMISLN